MQKAPSTSTTGSSAPDSLDFEDEEDEEWVAPEVFTPQPEYGMPTPVIEPPTLEESQVTVTHEVSDASPNEADAEKRKRKSKKKDKEKEKDKNKEKGKPNFKNSGLLAAATNTVKLQDGTSTVMKYNEPPEARKPTVGWRLYVFKGKEQVGASCTYMLFPVP